VILLPEFADATGCSSEEPGFDAPEGCNPPQAVNARLSMTVRVRKNSERVLVNIGPPARFFSFDEGVLLHVLPVMLRLLCADFWVNMGKIVDVTYPVIKQTD
jgi:hypothetical protein